MLNTFTLQIEGRELRLVHNPDTWKMRWYLDGQLINVFEDTSSAALYPWPFVKAEQDQLQVFLDWAHGDNKALLQVMRKDEVIDTQEFELEQMSPVMLEDANKSVIKRSGAQAPQSFSWLNIGIVAFKLVKSANVLKVALAATSLAAYSLIMSFEFAIALLAILIFHEYGHLVAMKRAGIPTKGMYLIPFVGGLAVGGKPSTRWQEVYISMMGPIFGLLMTIVFLIIYLVTDNQFAGLVASMSALLNLFNLIPVNPLDGGQVVKALLFSSKHRLAIVAALAISALCFVLSIKIGLYFLSFFIVIGVVDLVFSWRNKIIEDLVLLNTYGIVFSLIWYLATVAIFVGIILMLGDSLVGGEIAKKVLSS